MAIVGIKLLRTFGFGARNAFLLGREPVTRSTRCYASALFISGRKANETFALLMPYLDFDERLSDLNKFKTELRLRGVSVNVEGIKETWDFYKHMDSNRAVLEQRRTDIANKMKVFSKMSVLTADQEGEVARLKSLGKVIREDLKVVKETLWDLEESVVNQVLKLPTVLHDDTPPIEPLVLHSFGEPIVRDVETSKSHVEIGEGLGLLRYSNPMNYYLANEAAMFELGVLRSAANIFAANDMVRVTGLDFSRGVVVEGSGMDHENPEHSFILKDMEEIEKHSSNRMHLVGGASLASFLAMHTKQLINPNYFPLRYFATGRSYAPFSNASEEAGLFTVSQASAAQVFLAVKNSSNEYRQEFDKLVASLKHLYDGLCSHYRLVLRPARDLRPWETLRTSVELWSPYLSEYVEVGHVSLCGDYFSKRLLITLQTPQGRSFPSVISGTVLSVPRLLGCLLEEQPGKFVVPDSVREHVPGLRF